MEWSKLYDRSNPPTLDDISKYVVSELWEDLNSFLQSTYHIQPKFSYSRCSLQPGWNVKYQRGGRSLCALYPMEGFFITLVVIGSKETHEAELLMPSCSGYNRTLHFLNQF